MARLLEPLDWGLVRAPLLSTASYPRGAPHRLGAPLDSRVDAALAVGTDDLYAALERTPRDSRDADRLQRTLLRYLIRMSTRPTPYGLFAGVGLVAWGTRTDIALTAQSPRTRARPDMGGLLELVAELERDAGVRRQLRLFVNPLVLERAGRVILSERPNGTGAGNSRTSTGKLIRVTEAIARVIERARSPVAHAELTAMLCSLPGVSLADADALVDRLFDEAVLLTDLRPPLTHAQPARYVLDRLAGVRGAEAARDGLAALLDDLERWDALPLTRRAAAWGEACERARNAAPAFSTTAAQVDMALPLRGRHVHRAVATAAAEAAELLLRLSPYPAGLPYLRAYRERFEARYGIAREVPLLELLDPEFGLGPADAWDGRRDPADPMRDASRARALREVALEAQRTRNPVLHLDDGLLARLESWSPSPESCPRSLELSVSIAAASPAAVDDRDFLLVVGPYVGAEAAGRCLGRFADLLGTPARRALDAVARREEDEAHTWAELVYLPFPPRSANIAVRPNVVGREIVFGTVPGTSPEHPIPPAELLVGVRGERFYLRWPGADGDVVVSSKHMHNALHAPAPIRFLQDLDRDGRVAFSPFDWGPAADFPFLPRVQRGRIVLAPAQWRLSGLIDPGAAGMDAVAAWRDEWSVPRQVSVGTGDRRLLLDLEDRLHTELLRDELRRSPRVREVVVQEALPCLEDAWLPGGDGSHIAELVVPLAPRARPVRRAHRHTARPAREASLRAARLRPPGSDWVFLVLYGPPSLEDDLITEELAPFVDFAEATTLVDRWFFVRDSDPDPHLRVRFHGGQEALGRLLPQACELAASLVGDGWCHRFAIETYERELERYGGEEGMSLAEEVFAADSRATLELLRVAPALRELDRTSLAVLSVDRLLKGLGATSEERLAWYGSHGRARADGQEFRRRKDLLRPLLANGAPAGPAGAVLARMLEERSRLLQRVTARLRRLAADGDLSCSRWSLYDSHVHMHCNRLLGREPAIEDLVLGLARRTHESLIRAPLHALTCRPRV